MTWTLSHVREAYRRGYAKGWGDKHDDARGYGKGWEERARKAGAMIIEPHERLRFETITNEDEIDAILEQCDGELA